MENLLSQYKALSREEKLELVAKNHHIPHGQHLALFVKLNLETDGFHSPSDVDSVTIHVRPGQVGTTAKPSSSAC